MDAGWKAAAAAEMRSAATVREVLRIPFLRQIGGAAACPDAKVSRLFHRAYAEMARVEWTEACAFASGRGQIDPRWW